MDKQITITKKQYEDIAAPVVEKVSKHIANDDMMYSLIINTLLLKVVSDIGMEMFKDN